MWMNPMDSSPLSFNTVRNRHLNSVNNINDNGFNVAHLDNDFNLFAPT